MLNSFDNFTLSCVNKVAKGTQSFASVILKVTAVPLFHTAPALSIPSPLDNTQFSIRVNESSTLQLIRGISKDPQKLLKCFNCTAIFAFCFFPFAPLATALPTRLDL